MPRSPSPQVVRSLFEGTILYLLRLSLEADPTDFLEDFRESTRKLKQKIQEALFPYSSREGLSFAIEGVFRCIINRLYYAAHMFFASHSGIWRRGEAPSVLTEDQRESLRRRHLQRGVSYPSERAYRYPEYQKLHGAMPKNVARLVGPAFKEGQIRNWICSLYNLRCDADYQPELEFREDKLELALEFYRKLRRVMDRILE